MRKKRHQTGKIFSFILLGLGCLCLISGGILIGRQMSANPKAESSAREKVPYEQEKITDENPEAGMHFTAASGIMMAKSGQTNLRTLPTTNAPSQVVAQLTGDATAERIAEDKDRGWTKLIYNGQTVYAVSSYLTQVG